MVVSDLFHSGSTLVESECMKKQNDAIAKAPKLNNQVQYINLILHADAHSEVWNTNLTILTKLLAT